MNTLAPDTSCRKLFRHKELSETHRRSEEIHLLLEPNLTFVSPLWWYSRATVSFRDLWSFHKKQIPVLVAQQFFYLVRFRKNEGGERPNTSTDSNWGQASWQKFTTVTSFMMCTTAAAVSRLVCSPVRWLKGARKPLCSCITFCPTVTGALCFVTLNHVWKLILNWSGSLEAPIWPVR